MLNLPEPPTVVALLGEDGLAALRGEADEIVNGRVRLFGAEPVPLALAPPAPLHHWTEYEGKAPELGDLKFIWEPAALRLGVHPGTGLLADRG